MKLYELAFTGYIYSSFTPFNLIFKAFFKDVTGRLDLLEPGHRKSLIVWLSKGGYRQFTLEYHQAVSDIILAWYKEGHTEKIPQDKMLWELNDKELEEITYIFDALAGRKVSQKARGGKSVSVKVGPTGASKILFALRPEIAAPWDEAIRIGLGYDGSGVSYLEYLRRIIIETEDLTVSCSKNNIELLQVPPVIGRSDSTITQLIGEYFWVTETRKCYPPSSETIQCWAKWGQ